MGHIRLGRLPRTRSTAVSVFCTVSQRWDELSPSMLNGGGPAARRAYAVRAWQMGQVS